MEDLVGLVLIAVATGAVAVGSGNSSVEPVVACEVTDRSCLLSVVRCVVYPVTSRSVGDVIVVTSCRIALDSVDATVFAAVTSALV